MQILKVNPIVEATVSNGVNPAIPYTYWFSAVTMICLESLTVTTTNFMRDRSNHIISLLFNLSRLVRENERHASSKKQLDPFTFLRFKTLDYVREKKNPHMKEVADYLCVAPPSATSLVTSLVKNNLLKRQSDPRDRRAIHLSITPKGEKLLLKSREEMAKRMRLLFRHLDQKDEDSLITILEKLATKYTH